jgi:hypothetical protein
MSAASTAVDVTTIQTILDPNANAGAGLPRFSFSAKAQSQRNTVPS